MNSAQQPIQDDYRVALDHFQGPLDLLLFLIRKAEVDITDIPITTVTDQYIKLLGEVDSIDIDQAGEFLVMAATLVEIKSRVLERARSGNRRSAEGDVTDADLPDTIDLEADDPRYELVQQLLAYQRYRQAADRLDEMRHDFANRFEVHPNRFDPAADPAPEPELELEDVHAFDLLSAYERIVASIDFSKLGEHEVLDDDTPIGLHQEDLLDRLRNADGTIKRITLQQAWMGRRKIDVIGLFLATLELVRQRRLLVVQDETSEEILLELNDDPDVPHAEDDEYHEPAPSHQPDNSDADNQQSSTE
ncbi:MAG: segregation and condensation protein A [Phycisphaerales bacterium]